MRSVCGGTDLGGEIEVVNGGQKQPRLANDLLRPVAIAAVGGTEILSFDDLGKADDRVERGLDLVDQFAKRVRVGERLRRFLRDRRFGRFAQRDSAIAAEAAV